MDITMEQDDEMHLIAVVKMVDRCGLPGCPQCSMVLELLEQDCRVHADVWRLDGPSPNARLAEQWTQEADRIAAFNREP